MPFKTAGDCWRRVTTGARLARTDLSDRVGDRDGDRGRCHPPPDARIDLLVVHETTKARLHHRPGDIPQSVG
jgi:hypothetical protein